MEACEIRLWEKGKWAASNEGESYVTEGQILLHNLIEEAKVGICSYISEDRVISKAMFIAKKKDCFEFWFNTDSTAELSEAVSDKKNFTLFIFDSEKVMSAMLTGKMEVESNLEIKREVWRTEFDEWYNDGIESAEYMVIHFHAQECRFFHDGVRMELSGG